LSGRFGVRDGALKVVREDENTPDRPGGYTMRVVPAKGRPTLHKRRSREEAKR
jgi:hypothetical protein